jgi:hypothetical protein
MASTSTGTNSRYGTVAVTRDDGWRDHLGAKSGRESLLIQNTSSSVDVYVGPGYVITTSNGIKLAAGASMVFNEYTGAVYGVVASGSADVRYWEVY